MKPRLKISDRQYTLIPLALITLALASGCSDSGNGTSVAPPQEELRLVNAKLLIEHNASDDDTGFQGFAEGDPWNRLSIAGPDGKNIATVMVEGNLKDFGLTEFFFETQEPDHDEVPMESVLGRLALGAYNFVGEIIARASHAIGAVFSHDIPAGPNLVSPANGSVGLSPNGIAVTWEPVTRDINGKTGIHIVGYQLIVEEDVNPEHPNAFYKPVLSVHVPPTTTSISIPPGFLKDNGCYKFEVLAIEESGNQSLTEAGFNTGAGCAERPEEPETTPRMKVAKLLIEHNATDNDTGFQGFADGDPWNRLTIAGPDGKPLLIAQPENSLVNFGLTEFFFESAEPNHANTPLSQVLSRLPQGIYSFTGDLVGGGSSMTIATLSHAMPAAPTLLAPANGARDVDPGNTVVSWQPVSKDLSGAPIQIAGYQVIVEIDQPQAYPQGFARSAFSIYMPSSATSVRIPREFLAADQEYKYEILAIAVNGNQTLASAEFKTK